MFVEFKDYMFVDNPDDRDHTAIKLLSGPYEGVVYCYTIFKGITEDNERLSAILSFEYHVFEDLGLITDEQHFREWIGEVLTSHVTSINQSENPKEQMVFNDEEPRNDNHTEPATE